MEQAQAPVAPNQKPGWRTNRAKGGQLIGTSSVRRKTPAECVRKGPEIKVGWIGWKP